VVVVVVMRASVCISVLFSIVLIAYVQVWVVLSFRLLLVLAFSPRRLRYNPGLVNFECAVKRVALGRVSSKTTAFQAAPH
jgi:hypothetical protein